MDAAVEGHARAWGWVAHLSDGGRTPWSEWSGAAPARGVHLPGAQQLELLRRLNAHAADAGLRLPAGLAARTLVADAAGRGQPDRPLRGAGERRWGPRPVDPAQQPAHELLRVATTLVAEDLVALGVDDGRPVRRVRWGRAHLVVGDPVAVSGVRAALARRGRPVLGRGRRVVVLAEDVATMLAHTWTDQCFTHAGVGAWEDWLAQWPERDALPPRIDVPRLARRAGRVRDVRVVIGRELLARDAARCLGVRRLPPVTAPGADAAEVARRVASVLRIMVPASEADRLVGQTLRRRVPSTGVPAPAVPAEQREWVRRTATALAEDVRTGGYAVLGDPDALVPDPSDAGPGGGIDDTALALAVRMLVDRSWQHGPRKA